MVSAKILRKVLMQLNQAWMIKRNSRCKINCLNDGLVVLGLATSHHENKTDAGTPDWPSLVSPSMVSVFVGRRLTMTLLPPANVRRLEQKKFYICSDVTHTHTPAHSGVWLFWKNIAAEVGRTNQIQWDYTMLVYRAAVISLRREIRFELKYLDRVTEAHAFNHPPRVVDFSRCHSCRQSGWKLFGQLLDLRS